MEKITGNAEKIVTFLMGQDRNLVWDVKPHREHRTLSQNAYYWVLLGKTADVLRMSKSALHNRMLRNYGQYMRINGQIVTTALPDTDDTEKMVLEAETYHLKPTSQVRLGKHDTMYRTYVFMRGSSDYNTKEMTVLLDGLIQEAQSVEVETLTPDELARMREYEQRKETRHDN